MSSNNQNRRDVLKSLTTLAAASSIASAMSQSSARAAGAAGADPGLSPALGQVDQALRQAVNAGTVPGIVDHGR
jgi:methyl acetate hydrolase